MNMMLLSLLLISLPASALIGQNASTGYGRVGYLHVEGTYGSRCLATLLEQDIAVTSAHCLSGFDWRSRTVYFARSGEAGLSPIDDVEVSPEYAPATKLSSSDIALVRLKHEWGAADSAYPLAERPVGLESEATVISLQHNEGNMRDQRPDALGTVQIVFRNAGNSPDLIVAGTKDSAGKLCPGDSGAPVVQEGMLVGIIAAGTMPTNIPREQLTCKDFSNPQVLSLHYHREWIKKAVRQLRSRQESAKAAGDARPALAPRLPSAAELSAMLAR